MRRIIKKLRSPFARFLSKKIVFLLVALFIAMSLLFIFPRLMPSDPAKIMISRLAAGESTAISPGGLPTGGGGPFYVLRQIYEEKFGVHEPLHIQYVAFWKRFFTMDFGLSYWRYPTPVSSLVGYALLWTLALILPIIPIGFVVGNWIGSRAAYSRGKLDRVLYYVSLYMFQAPYYWFALIFIFIFGITLRWFPAFGAYSTSVWIRPVISIDWFLDALYHYTLPFLSLLGLGIGGWAIGMRAMTIYEMESDYIQYSKQLGFSRGKLRSYAEHNAILPNFTWIPMAISGLISQTLLVEVVFKYPGLGNLMYNAVFAYDYPLLEACLVVTILIVLVGNFLADLLYGKIDPRIATGYVGER